MSDDNSKTVADRIKELRIEQGLTQMDLAKKIGKKDKSSICKIEGKKNDITLKDVSRVAMALGTTPEHLMGWDKPQKPNEKTGELLVEIRKSPRLLRLVEDFMKLNQAQQESVLALIHSMIPDKRL